MYLSVYLSTYLSIYSVFLSIFLSILSFCKIENAEILQDFLNFRRWQHQKRSNAARLPSIFEVDNIKNEAILRDCLQKWKVQCTADGLVPMRFVFFPFHLCKVLRLPRKSDARSYEVLHLSRKIILANLKMWCSKMQCSPRKSAPDLLISLMNRSLALRLPREIHLCRSSANVPRLLSFLDMLQNPHILLIFGNAQNPLCLPRRTTSERQKVVRTCGAFNILTSKFASRHNGVHFFDISTSKSAPNVMCF